MLIGRAAQCAALDQLLEDARASRGGALVLRGEPGVGKTSLLRYARERAADLRVLEGLGIEGESELAFAALHQMLLGELERIDALPAPQAEAMKVAFGLAEPRQTDPFLASLGVLGLLAEIAGEGPVLCLVDDAQWLDEASASALLFAARRLEADP